MLSCAVCVVLQVVCLWICRSSFPWAPCWRRPTCSTTWASTKSTASGRNRVYREGPEVNVKISCSNITSWQFLSYLINIINKYITQIKCTDSKSCIFIRMENAAAFKGTFWLKKSSINKQYSPQWANNRLVSSHRRPLNWYRNMEENWRWMCSRPTGKVCDQSSDWKKVIH